jgi:hypothetical protein
MFSEIFADQPMTPVLWGSQGAGRTSTQSFSQKLPGVARKVGRSNKIINTQNIVYLVGGLEHFFFIFWVFHHSN